MKALTRSTYTTNIQPLTDSGYALLLWQANTPRATISQFPGTSRRLRCESHTMNTMLLGAIF